MSQYTEMLKLRAETLSPDDDGYEESLLEVASLFRGFDEALTAFLLSHGYGGDPADAQAKAQFLRERFRAAGIEPVPRGIRGWFTPNRTISRKTAFQICFAFGLDAAGTNEFFRTVQFERGFDCHTVSEAVYYFCMRGGLPYARAQAILSRLPDTERRKALPRGDVLYTGTIVAHIEAIRDEERLIRYIEDNLEHFGYNNVTAIKFLQGLWASIAGSNGLAAREGKLIDESRNAFHPDRRKRPVCDSRSREVVEAEIRREEELMRDDYVVSNGESSTWTIYTQILGLDRSLEERCAPTRSLAPVLTRNVLLPLRAADCFPNRQTIDQMLRGETGDHEPIRKLIIFLVFYTFWAKKLVESGSAFFTAGYSDAGRCLDTINKYLLDAGYPELYPWNPYDWIFLWALHDAHPLEAFRSYILELFIAKDSGSA